MRCHTITRADGSTEEVCPALGTLEERARFALAAADQQLAAAEAQRDALKAEHWAQMQVAEAAIEVASKQVSVAEAQVQQLLEEAREEDIALAKIGVDQAKASLIAARTHVADTELRAPINGTIGAVDTRAGEYASPGLPLVRIGDLTTLRVETTDLDEIDVGRVRVDQTAVVAFDAIPDRTFDATVVAIAPMASGEGGGVNYTVALQMSELDPKLRWGMTAFIDIAVE
jgi:multidrug resistance efflux pump